MVKTTEARDGGQALVVDFTREKETKNTVRFQEDAVGGRSPIIGSLYVQKWAVGDARSLRVTLEVR